MMIFLLCFIAAVSTILIYQLLQAQKETLKTLQTILTAQVEVIQHQKDILAEARATKHVIQGKGL